MTREDIAKGTVNKEKTSEALNDNVRRSDLVLNEGQIDWLPRNPRQWTQDDIDRTKASLLRDSDFQEDRPLLVLQYGDSLLVFAGNLRTTSAKSLNWDTLEAVLYTPETEDDRVTVKRRAMLDNGSFGEWDVDVLANEWDDQPLKEWGVDVQWGNVEIEETSSANDKQDLSNDIETSFRVEIVCASEGEQEKIYSEMVGRGLECRILTL